MTRVLSSEGGIELRSETQESVGCDAERHVMVKASPASTFIVIEAQFLLEFLIVALDPPAQFGSFPSLARAVSAARVESQYLVGALSSCGHSTSGHSSA